MLMVILVLVVLGLSLGSFVNALVWRVHEKRNWFNDRSVCTNCNHVLSPKDLVPIASWIILRGKCRYCKHKISSQYPIIESLVTILFILSYVLWPTSFNSIEFVIFSMWLVLVTGLIALAVYDLHYMLLPTKMIYSLLILAIAMSVIRVVISSNPVSVLLNMLFGSLAIGGVFYALYAISKGKWIGGGDVRLGFLLGLLVSTPGRSFLLVFIASLIGSVVAVLLLSAKKIKPKNLIPFGPFLITALFIVQFWGQDILNWYKGLFI